LLSEFKHAVDGAPHEQDPATYSESEFAMPHGYTVPVTPLLAQLAVLDKRGMTERAAQVRAHMRKMA
jgi:hypothetical protein